MAYIGNKNGPRESQVLQSLDHSYFGCSPAGLADEISFAELSEQRGEVVPVHIDESGGPYVVYSSSTPGRTQRFYLEEHGIELAGDVRTFTEEEQVRWVVRSLVKEN